VTVACVSAGAGFLLAVLWFDLMFDVQVARGASAEAVESIARYYRRVTTDARPMNRLVAAAMVATVAGVIYEVARSIGPVWARWVSLVLVLAPVAVAGSMTVKRAVRLGSQVDPPERQAEMTRANLREHAFCFVCISALLAVQLLAVTA
jgi:hypothetical protein